MGSSCSIIETIDDTCDEDDYIQNSTTYYKRSDAYLTRGASWSNSGVIYESYKC